ncbi:hypothetical protein EXIGLDRAFT_112622 [Exidia glandulosa HHB12029]|uniref:Protein kinase domain-containing protein n=1 Tax=Exidia glandulosa HHB12029 TaxID=1314781 RepID=A0A165NMR9_EXIGL|nr:hypothetical protein EXIGLDRAFT_112622 [Exidia glandulosa HHB12029]
MSATVTDNIAFHSDIRDHEKPWVALQPGFERLGYRFRPRFRQGWAPSWDWSPQDLVSRLEYEDALVLTRVKIMDATRIHDNARVVIKMLFAECRAAEEAAIAEFLGGSDPEFKRPIVPLLEKIVFPSRPDLTFLVFPELVRWDTRPFTFVAEALDFARQAIYALLFMHHNGVAHGDISPGNIMVDGLHFFVNDPHPADLDRTRATFAQDNRLHSYDRPIFPTYYFIDFGFSFAPAPGSVLRVQGAYGTDYSVPEFSGPADERIDPFKADLWSMGRFLLVYVVDAYVGLDMLRPVVNALRQVNPDERMSAADAFQWIDDLIGRMSDAELLAPISHRLDYDLHGVVAEEMNTAIRLRTLGNN